MDTVEESVVIRDPETPSEMVLSLAVCLAMIVTVRLLHLGVALIKVLVAITIPTRLSMIRGIEFGDFSAKWT